MDDEQILKRLAEIEGKDLARYVYRDGWFHMHIGLGVDVWSPLNSKADAFALIEKLLIKGWHLYAFGDDVFKFRPPRDDQYDILSKDLKRGACLATIEANATRTAHNMGCDSEDVGDDYLKHITEEVPEWIVRREIIPRDRRIEELERVLQEIAYMGSSVPLGMQPEDFYHGQMNACISLAARSIRE